MIKLLLRLSIPALAVLLAAYILPGVHVESFLYAVIIAVVLGFINLFVKPILEILTIPITVLTLGFFLIILDALMVLLAARLVTGFHVDNILWAVLLGIIVSIASAIMENILGDSE